jgi:hypothetical protein
MRMRMRGICKGAGELIRERNGAPLLMDGTGGSLRMRSVADSGAKVEGWIELGLFHADPENGVGQVLKGVLVMASHEG